jgi:hypothetical protein
VSVPADRRAVVILSPDLDTAPPLGDAELEDVGRIVVIAIGWPLRPRQLTALDDAIDSARRRAIELEAVLVASAADVSRELRPHDMIRVLGSARERRRIETVVGLGQRS